MVVNLNWIVGVGLPLPLTSSVLAILEKSAVWLGLASAGAGGFSVSCFAASASAFFGDLHTDDR